jgi:hypothetical protein
VTILAAAVHEIRTERAQAEDPFALVGGPAMSVRTQP